MHNLKTKPSALHAPRCGGFAIRRNRVSGFVIRLRQDVDVAVGVTMVNGIWPWALVYSAARM